MKLFSDIFVNIQTNRKLLQTSECELKLPKIAYAVVSTPRSGSTALCETLTATKIAGFPQEDLRHPSQILTQYCKFDPVRYLHILMMNQTTNNGVFGTKLISHFLQDHFQSSSNFHQIIDEFKFIYLIRRDKIAQAVSSFLGEKTNMWHIYSGEQSKNYQSKLEKINIEDTDLEEIHNKYQYLLNQESFLKDFFHEHQISPLIVDYEKFIEFPEDNLNQIAKYLGILGNQKINVVNKYQYKIYEIMKSFKLIGKNQQIKVKLKTRPLKSNISKQAIGSYQDKYCKTT
ncbi:MAG: Stf0 family sulfotransferase [Cyanobacteriota bacterium]|nr:Stf0 family sulfotransferase [Cyanobacteriota bacterium]